MGQPSHCTSTACHCISGVAHSSNLRSLPGQSRPFATSSLPSTYQQMGVLHVCCVCARPAENVRPVIGQRAVPTQLRWLSAWYSMRLLIKTSYAPAAPKAQVLLASPCPPLILPPAPSLCAAAGSPSSHLILFHICFCSRRIARSHRSVQSSPNGCSLASSFTAGAADAAAALGALPAVASSGPAKGRGTFH